MSKDQVDLEGLIFTQSWEDPESDRRAMGIRSDDVLFTITSGGCNTLGFLLDDPSKIYAVDINGSQSFVLELKMAAMKHLGYDDFIGFIGLSPSDRRREMYGDLSKALSDDARSYWEHNLPYLERGIIGQGKYERFIGLFRRILRVLQGSGRIEGMFRSETIEQQHTYFDEVWNTRRWRAIFQVFFNKWMLARRGLSAEYFHFDDGSASFADSFFRRSRGAMRDLPIRSNYFLSHYLLGRYLSQEAVPDYLKRENFEVIRSRLDRISVITEDAKEWLQNQSGQFIDCFSLSNICELMSLKDTSRTFESILKAARPGARMCFRNLMIPREVPAPLQQSIHRDAELSTQLLRSDRSFVYSRVDAMTV